MTYKNRKSVRIIQGASAEDLQEQINEVLEFASNPVVNVDLATLRAFIEYTEDAPVAESIAEKYELEGCKHTCSECPYLQRFDDKRKKPVCIIHSFKTSDNASVCDHFYRAMERRGHADFKRGTRASGSDRVGSC